MCAGVWNKMEKKNPLHLSEGKRMAIDALLLTRKLEIRLTHESRIEWSLAEGEFQGSNPVSSNCFFLSGLRG